MTPIQNYAYTKETLGVRFPSSQKVYHYFAEAGRYHINDVISVFSNGKNTTVEVVEKVLPSMSHATKDLPIVEEEGNKHYFDVKFIEKDGLSRGYGFCANDENLDAELYLMFNKRHINENEQHFVYTDMRGGKIVSIVKISRESFIAKFGQHRIPCVCNFSSITTAHIAILCKETKDYEEEIKEQLEYALYRKGIFANDYVVDKIKLLCNPAGIKKEEVNNNKEERLTMKNQFFGNFEFGKINTRDIAYSINGIAFRTNEGKYFNYNINKMEATDVTGLTFDTDFIFAMPVAHKDIKVGDTIKHNGKYAIVKEFYEDGTIAAINPAEATEISIIPVKNVFGFNYVTKVVNAFEGMAPDAEHPFGDINKMLPFMMLMNKDADGNTNDMLMYMLFAGAGDFQSNPMLAMALMQN